MPQSASLHLDHARTREAGEHAERARELAPENAATWTMLAAVARARGDLQTAEALATSALAMDPESVEALVLVGHAALERGEVPAAREHAAWALRQDPEDAAALALLCAIKARQSPWMGLWWRFQTWVTRGGGARTVVILLGLFLAYRAAAILLEGAGRTDIADAMRIAWLAFCVYTGLAPAILIKAVRRELEQVWLRPGF